MAAIERLFAILSPNITASYSTSLLETAKSNLIPCAIAFLLDVLRTIPAPPPWARDNPSVSSTHFSIPTSWESASELSTMKSTRACPLIVVLGRYSMSNSLSSIAYFNNLLVGFVKYGPDRRTREHYYGVSLEVRSKFLCYHLKRECNSLKVLISSLNLGEGVAEIIN